ncbi:MAG TPA: phytanoyl-CoA dioxygenase family protein [Candidatus Latescibacteria bacterium]|nr:phytanoyl-CoA dioxygenase family protein [Candidatus Handelsmanbacteria bacterium]HIL07510.1 phytanoyl-CoA dioxygenase family protein [Candidatus Latescibacterota bacterium]
MADDKITRYQDVEIDELPRDLRFRPCENKDPKVLTRAQIDTFNRDGYIKGIRIFSDEQIGEIRAYFDQLLAKVLAEGRDAYSINSAHLTYGRVFDLLANERITAHIKDLLGEHLVGWGSHFFCKMPRDRKTVSWHQDASYWPMTPSKTATVWLAIDDADVDNACMRFIPGSHHHGHLTYKLSEEDENNVLFQTVPTAEQYGEPIDVELKAGEISIHSDMLLHGSKANTSGRRRCGLTMRYCAAEVRALQGWHLKGVLLAGDDPQQHWANPPRPAQD